MYAVIRTYKMSAGSKEELAEILDRGFVPQISTSPGFVSYHALDTGAETVASISIFADRREAEESNRKAAEWVGANLGAFKLSQPEILGGEVLAHRS